MMKQNKHAVSPYNIVWIIADDLGYGDLNCYTPHYVAGENRRTLARTPNMDEMAGDGMLFTDCYAGQSMCAPSRACVLTGQHVGHNNCREIWATKDGARIGLKKGTPTFANLLKQTGYATGYFGKWHALYQTRGMDGNDREIMPHFGWDEWMVQALDNRGTSHWPSHVISNGEKLAIRENKHKHYPREGNWCDGRPEVVNHGRFFGDLVADYACEFFTRHRETPFVAHVGWMAPHTLFEAPDRDKLAAERGWDPETAGYVWLVEQLDRNVGTILDCLLKLGLEKNTVVFVTSDHGGVHYGKWNDSDYRQFTREQPNTGGLYQGKSFLYEGGIRVPMVVSCPGTIPAGSISDEPWYFADAMATFADIAGAESYLPENTDGQSIWPVLRGEREHLDDRPLYWESYNRYGGFRQAIRKGPWKLMRFSSLERTHPSNPELPDRSPNAYLELYDLAQDPGERNNLAEYNPTICRELAGVMNETYTPHADFPLSKTEGRVFGILTWDDIAQVFPD
jgi:arylsulfatase A